MPVAAGVMVGKCLQGNACLCRRVAYVLRVAFVAALIFMQEKSPLFFREFMLSYNVHAFVPYLFVHAEHAEENN